MKEHGYKLSEPKIINIFNKKQGYWYVYQDQCYWDAEKKSSRHTRTTIGKRMSKDGPILYNNRYKFEHAKDVLDTYRVSQTRFLGEDLVLEKYVKKFRLRKLLTDTFGSDDGEKILTVAKYSVATEAAFSWCGDWAEGNMAEPYGTLSSQEVSKLLSRITLDKRNTFFSQWLEENLSKYGYYCFDSSNVISYGEGDPFVEFGYSHGHEKIPQKNLAILTRQDTMIPVWFSEYCGSLHDSRTVEDLLKRIHKQDFRKVCFIMDKGYYSKSNLQLIESKGDKFIIPIPARIKWQYPVIDEMKDLLHASAGRLETMDSRGNLKVIQGATKRIIRNGQRYYVQIYYSPDTRAMRGKALTNLFYRCRKELEDDQRILSHEELYKRFFTWKKTPKKGIIVKDRTTVQAEFQNSYAGYWCLYTNHEKGPVKTYEAYAGRNSAELIFDDTKHEIDGHCERPYSVVTNWGRIFINFISLIILNGFKQDVKKHWKELTAIHLKNYRQLLFRMSTLSKVRFKRTYRAIYSEPTKTQTAILQAFSLKWPSG